MIMRKKLVVRKRRNLLNNDNERKSTKLRKQNIMITRNNGKMKEKLKI